MWCPNRECPDFVEDGCPGEYVDSVVTCPKCGAALVPERPLTGTHGRPRDREPAGPTLEEEARPAAAAELPERLVAIAAFDYPDETEPIMQTLLAHGITVFQFLDDGRDFADQQGFATCTRLLVPASQAAAALALLE